MSGTFGADWKDRFANPPCLLGTLFWLHGTESVEELRRTFDLAVSSGIGELTLESRPHWDFLGPGWWKDVKRILTWSRAAGVDVYLFDEKWYPSGVAGNTIQKMDPEFRRSSIRLQHIRYRGPQAGVSLMPPWSYRRTSTILSLFAYPVTEDGADYEKAIDLTTLLKRPDSPHMHGIYHGIQWDVPRGEWIICFIVEERADNYIDPLHPGAVEAFIDRVYESSKVQLGEYFGNPVKGFFFDEPGFFNDVNELPWGYNFRSRFIKAKGYDPMAYLPALWLKSDGKAPAAFVYDYYHFLHRTYAETYCRPIYEWCRENGLKYIGHWYEHEASPTHGGRYMFHERTTEGPGDFFEVSRFADEGGIDLVCNQVIPGHRNRDYWGLPKLSSSAAHIFGLKDDLALSETFGAYGWHLGLRMMKWLTDWQAVRGINHFILHAFNPRWPDLDCPPYFYDGGTNPQWPYFSRYVRYVNRLSWIFREGRHAAPILLLYPGALGQAGEVSPIEDIQRELTEHQFDYDLIPGRNLIEDIEVEENRLVLHRERYDALVIPGLQAVTSRLLQKLLAISDAGVPLLFADRLPVRVIDEEKEEAAESLSALVTRANVHTPDGGRSLPHVLTEIGIAPGIHYEGPAKADLRVLHRIREGQHVWFVSNESIRDSVSGWIRLHREVPVESVIAWEPMTGESWRLEKRRGESGLEFRLFLPPYRSLVLTEESMLMDAGSSTSLSDQAPAPYVPAGPAAGIESIAPKEIELHWPDGPRRGLPSWLTLDEAYSGTALYTWTWSMDEEEEEAEGKRRRIFLDLGRVEEIAEVEINGVTVGVSFIPPYRFDITAAVKRGTNRFQVRVTNVVSNRMSRAEEFESLVPDWKALREVHSLVEDGGLFGPVTLQRILNDRSE